MSCSPAVSDGTCGAACACRITRVRHSSANSEVVSGTDGDEKNVGEKYTSAHCYRSLLDVLGMNVPGDAFYIMGTGSGNKACSVYTSRLKFAECRKASLFAFELRSSSSPLLRTAIPMAVVDRPGRADVVVGLPKPKRPK